MIYNESEFRSLFDRVASQLGTACAIVWFTTPETNGTVTPLEVALTDPDLVWEWFNSTRREEGGVGQ